MREVIENLERLKLSILNAGTTASGSVFKDNQRWVDDIDNIERLIVGKAFEQLENDVEARGLEFDGLCVRKVESDE